MHVKALVLQFEAAGLALSCSLGKLDTKILREMSLLVSQCRALLVSQKHSPRHRTITEQGCLRNQTQIHVKALVLQPNAAWIAVHLFLVSQYGLHVLADIGGCPAVYPSACCSTFEAKIRLLNFCLYLCACALESRRRGSFLKLSLDQHVFRPLQV